MAGDDEDFEEFRTAVAVRVKGFRPVTYRPHVLISKRRGEKFVLDSNDYVMGRGEQATLMLDSEEVSRAHAKLTRTDGEYTVEDLGSRNGIMLNGLKVHAAVLRDGDEIQLGDVTLTYREGT
jgi:pSer/pThr/pTyr-binding forkhead associated (FHA) protein